MDVNQLCEFHPFPFIPSLPPFLLIVLYNHNLPCKGVAVVGPHSVLFVGDVALCQWKAFE